MPNRNRITGKERTLRAWFVRGHDPIDAVIDGLDIGWGGVQRWMTALLPLVECARHLDFACGYATFVAELAWRFPNLRIVGLNIDFEGPHALAEELVTRAGVADRCEFVHADAREMPFSNESFDSVSCFLGLQDIEIGFGEAGVRAALAEAVRVLKPSGILAIADEFLLQRFGELLAPLPLEGLELRERTIDARWRREIAERAIELYAEGWEGQVRSEDPEAKAKAHAEAHEQMREEMERQLGKTGTYTPFGPIRLAIARKHCG